MATIVCKQCPKTFKTETGFAWHHAHQHDLAQANDSVDPIPRLNSEFSASTAPKTGSYRGKSDRTRACHGSAGRNSIAATPLFESVRLGAAEALVLWNP